MFGSNFIEVLVCLYYTDLEYKLHPNVYYESKK